MKSDELREALRPIMDPELGFSIVDLGLVYGVSFEAASRTAQVVMTFTSPACPAGAEFLERIQVALKALRGIEKVDVEITFTPQWSPDKATKHVQEHFALLGIPLSSM